MSYTNDLLYSDSGGRIRGGGGGGGGGCVRCRVIIKYLLRNGAQPRAAAVVDRFIHNITRGPEIRTGPARARLRTDGRPVDVPTLTYSVRVRALLLLLLINTRIVRVA